MSANEITTEELTERTDQRHKIGVDSKGRDHYADTALGAVWVVDDEIAHVEAGASVSEWVDYVADGVGWETCTYDDRPFAEWLADALDKAGVA